jgi:hypothetical protein
MLVGAGLTQLGATAGDLEEASVALVPTLGDEQGGAFAVPLGLCCLIAAFRILVLWTRVRLAALLRSSNVTALNKRLDQAEYAVGLQQFGLLQTTTPVTQQSLTKDLRVAPDWVRHQDHAQAKEIREKYWRNSGDQTMLKLPIPSMGRSSPPTTSDTSATTPTSVTP